MGALAKIGYEIVWSGGDCRVHGPAGEKINVQVVNGCPMIECKKGMQLMEQLENDSQLSAARTAIVSAIMKQPDLMHQLQELDAETLFTVMIKKEFPDLPDAICRRVVPKMSEIDSEKLPWNRRLRRKMMKSKRVVLHLFSGPDEKTWKVLDDADTMVICVDKVLHPRSDVLNDHLMMFLLKLAMTGSVHAILGGPPCRSVSACRYADDGGPKPVRSEQEPYGLATLSQQQRDWVEDDIAMLFRMKLIYMVADHYRPSWCEQVIFALEQPQDPKEYRPQQDIDKHHYMSIWRTTAWKLFQAKYNLTLTSFQQGAFGHPKPKPTTFAHNLQGFEELEGAKAVYENPDHGWRDRPLEERIQESATWAQWAPGLKAALIEGLKRQFKRRDAGRCHIGAPGNAEEATWDSDDDSSKPMHQQPQLCPLSAVALTKWKAHILNDHQPMRRDCRVCVEAAGQSRHHRRIQHPSAYCLSMDLSGKMKRGKDQFGSAGAYILIGCYTFPTTLDDVPLCGPDQQRPPEDAPLPSLGEVVDEDGVDGDVEDGELPRFEADVEDQPCEEDDAATNRAKTAFDSWMKLVEEHKQVKVKTLTFAEVITSRATGHVLEGLAKIYAKIRSLALPVLRLHADRARELTSKAIQAWCHSRDIVATYTSGSDWKSNGRAENEIGIVKRHAKILMRAHNINEERWPILVKHAAERRLRWQLQQVGYPVPDLLPFYTKVLVKRKSWNQRYAAWRWERAPGRICGPDPWSSLTSGGYCVQLEDGTFLASTDVVVEQSELGEGLTLDLVVQERLQAPGEQQISEIPKRRLRFKQGVPQMARLELGSNSGEKVDVQAKCNSECDHVEVKRLLKMHQETAKVLSEECVLVDDLDPEQAACIPALAMLANQKFDLELQLRALDLEKKHKEEEENFLVTKTITTEQVYKEWDDWKLAMMSEYTSIVEEKKAVRQVKRCEAQRMATESNIKYEELPSKVVFTRKMGGKRKVRACICGNYENEVATATYAGGCDASQIRCLIRHAALEKWALYGTDIKCAFLNAERKDRTKLIAMSIPYIYVKLGLASHQDVWLVDAAMYGLVASPRDWSDHRDETIPNMVWQREEDGKKWKGTFKRAADQHLWHLQEECLESGEVCKRGLMAIYVDDVLLAAGDPVATCALKAIAEVWECAEPERATLEKPVSFCGFEIQQNSSERGGGFRLHQHSYEEELIKKWEVHQSSSQVDFKLPLPEEEAEFVKSENLDLVRRAQACTGALLWLATRTRPELSVGVAAMSRLCTKAPEITINLGLKMMSYLKRPSHGMIYADQPGPVHGARGQLSKPRCVRTVEAFSDISYASTKGYKSLQGQVYYYAGAPVMWNTSRQPFPTQSTAESELVSLCEALVGGRATAALIAAIRDEPPEKLVKRLWGDNAAAISLATGEGQGSWRTRHLRIRAAILRSALRHNEWDLGHLLGRELVADSFTKIVTGPAFEKALQDLCIASDELKAHGDGAGMRHDQMNAKIAMLLGATLLSGAAATSDEEGDDQLSWLWVVGLILMCVGAVYVSDKMVRSGMWLYRRLIGASGSQVDVMSKGRPPSPSISMLQWSSSSEDERERRAEMNAQRAAYAQQADVDELRAMVAQSRRIQEDPHNKMHGRTPEMYEDTSQLPRRRKKKAEKKQRDPEAEEAAVERAHRDLMKHLGNIGGGPFSRRRSSRSGSGGAAASFAPGSMEFGYGEPSYVAASSNQSALRSGSGVAASSNQSALRSGSGVAASSNQSALRSGSGVAASSNQSASRSGSGFASSSNQSASRSGSGIASTSNQSAMPSGSGAAVVASVGDERRSEGSTNRWNEFQHEHSGRSWGSDKFRAECWKYRATGQKPK